ncbi:MAG: helix-turn-helix transcriptional regulator [Silicimonas sp.]|nr:helix-turn-helix transcriptional regulator [Silicimonas sp.]
METAAEPHEFLTVRELAELLRIKERKVYDLAASGRVPCSRATGKLLFPAGEIRAWIDGAKSGGARTGAERPLIFLGSHDPLLDWAIRQSQSGLATFFDGSHDGLARFAAAEGVAAGLHIHDAATGDWNVTEAARMAEGQNAVLVRFARRARGIVFRGEGPQVAGVAGLRGMRVVPRQANSGTARLFAGLLERHGLTPADIVQTDVARTEDDAVQMVRQGEADATFGLQSVADTYGLRFLPVIEECFDLLVDRKAWFDPPLQTFFGFVGSDAFRDRADSMAGYDISETGTVIWNG